MINNYLTIYGSEDTENKWTNETIKNQSIFCHLLQNAFKMTTLRILKLYLLLNYLETLVI